MPFFFIFDWLGIEKFEWPNRKTFILLSVNALIGTVISDYCWARSVVLLGPLITCLGITLTFPISLTIDVWSNGESFSWQYYVGSLLIFTAFGGIITLDYREEQRKNKAQKDFTSLNIDSVKRGEMELDVENVSLLQQPDFSAN